MTGLTRMFNVETRAITNVQRKYSGQVNDSRSTTLFFEYNPATFLDGDEYIPYIVFNVHDADGNPLVYGPESTPRFNGWEFSVPWDVTSRVQDKNGRVDYQLFFVKNTVTFNGNVAQLDSTEYIQSAPDGIVLKQSIQCKKKNTCCPPMAPTTEPNVVGYINLWKDYGMVVPVEQTYNPETDMYELLFHTYNGTNDCTIGLNVPKLEDGRIPHRFLDMITSLGDADVSAEEYKIPTAKAVLDWLFMEYTPKTMSIAKWDIEREYSRESTVVHNENIYISTKDGNIGHEPNPDTTVEDEWWSTLTEYDLIVNEWSAEPRTNKVPSEKLVYDTFETKLDDTQLTTEWHPTPSDYYIPSEKLVSDTFDTKVDDTQIIEEWGNLNPSETQIASAKLTATSLDKKLDKEKLVATWNEPSNDKIASQKLVKDTLDDKLDDSQIVRSWNATPSDDLIPSEKLVKESLDEKTDYRMAIRFWYPEVMYGNGSTVIYDGTIYISKADENRGHVPSESTGLSPWWSKIEGGGSSGGNANKYVDIIGNGTDTVFEIHHGLGTADVFYTMRFNDSQRMFTDADVYVIDDNTVRIETYEPLETDSVVVILTPIMNELTVFKTIGNGQDTEFVIEHDFGTLNYFVSIKDITTGLIVKANVFALDAFRTKIAFNTPPATDSIRVILTSIMRVSEGGQGAFLFNDSDTWVVNHNYGKIVSIQAFDNDGYELTGIIKQNMATLNSATIKFNEPKSGFVVVR